MVRSDNGDDNDRDHDHNRSAVAAPESLLPTGYHHIHNRSQKSPLLLSMQTCRHVAPQRCSLKSTLTGLATTLLSPNGSPHTLCSASKLRLKPIPKRETIVTDNADMRDHESTVCGTPSRADGEGTL